MRILQYQKATTPPYSRYVACLPEMFSRLERFLARLLPEPILAGLVLFRRRNCYDAVVTAHYRTSIIFGLLCRLFGRRCRHVVKELYLDEAVLHARFARSVFRLALRHCECVITNCSAEIPVYSEFLDLPADRFVFLPWPSNLPISTDAPDDGYVYAAGRSFRDWQVVFDAARRFPEATFIVTAESSALAGLDRPNNVRLCCDVPRKKYLELLHGARIVVVPLLPTVRSTGQAVILEAMALGKPIVTAAVPGVLDYLSDGENGLLYEASDVESLTEQLDLLLADGNLRHRLGRGAVRSIRSTFNKVRYSRKMVRLMRDLVRRKPQPVSGAPEPPVQVLAARVAVDPAMLRTSAAAPRQSGR
jgi:glycosyltransferase involved in cell wall biosynthesis